MKANMCKYGYAKIGRIQIVLYTYCLESRLDFFTTKFVIEINNRSTIKLNL